MARILIYDPGGKKRQHLQVILREHAGDSVSLTEDMRLEPDLTGIDHVYIWNGQSTAQRTVADRSAAMGIQTTFLELGFFPQSDWLFRDPDGVGAASALYHDTESAAHDHGLLDRVRDHFLGGRRWEGGGGFTLVPLQVENDTNITLHSRFTSMAEFMVHCREVIDGKIVFKAHPKGILLGAPELPNCEIVRAGPSVEWIARADAVYGINSTVLLEAVLMGAPMRAIGRGHAARAMVERDEYLSSLVSSQVFVGR